MAATKDNSIFEILHTDRTLKSFGEFAVLFFLLFALFIHLDSHSFGLFFHAGTHQIEPLILKSAELLKDECSMTSPVSWSEVIILATSLQSASSTGRSAMNVLAEGVVVVQVRPSFSQNSVTVARSWYSGGRVAFSGW